MIFHPLLYVCALIAFLLCDSIYSFSLLPAALIKTLITALLYLLLAFPLLSSYVAITTNKIMYIN